MSPIRSGETGTRLGLKEIQAFSSVHSDFQNHMDGLFQEVTRNSCLVWVLEGP